MNEENFPAIFITVSSGLLAFASYQLFKLHKDDPKAYYRIEILPKEIMRPKAVVKQKIDKKGIKKDASKAINEFISTIKDLGYDVTSIYEKFHPDMIEETRGEDAGTYDRRTNKLLIDPNDVRNSLLRALLDMYTSREYMTFTVRGFERTVCAKKIPYNTIENVSTFARGLNEGYKDVFLQRHFGVQPKYEELANMVRLLEIILGQKEMEKMFVKGDTLAFSDNLWISHKKNIDSDYRWDIGKRTIYMMDKLYSQIYQSGLLGTILSSKRFSSFFTELSIFAMKTINEKTRKLDREIAQRCFHPANDYFWEAPLIEFEKYKANEYYTSRESIKSEYMKLRNIVDEYRQSTKLKPADLSKLQDAEKKYQISPIRIN